MAQVRPQGMFSFGHIDRQWRTATLNQFWPFISMVFPLFSVRLLFPPLCSSWPRSLKWCVFQAMRLYGMMLFLWSLRTLIHQAIRLYGVIGVWGSSVHQAIRLYGVDAEGDVPFTYLLVHDP